MKQTDLKVELWLLIVLRYTNTLTYLHPQDYELHENTNFKPVLDWIDNNRLIKK